LHLHPKTIAKWSARSHFEPRRSVSPGSVLDPFKPRVTRLLDTYPTRVRIAGACTLECMRGE